MSHAKIDCGWFVQLRIVVQHTNYRMTGWKPIPLFSRLRDAYLVAGFAFTKEINPITKNSANKFAIRNAMAAKSAIG